MKNKVGIIICYFGKLPGLFEIWKKTCETNAEFDFLIFTDQKISVFKENIHVYNSSLNEIKSLAEKKLGIKDISLNTAYKLCDYKPMYGLIFSEYLYGYDYWGMCDMDMLFGDLGKYITDEILDEYEKIYQLGHLTIYRNNNEVNRRFMSIGYCDWRTVVKTDEHCRFCERGMIAKYNALGIKAYTQKDYADISKLHKRFQLSKWMVPKSQFDRYKHQVFYYENGCVYRAIFYNKSVSVEEFNYIHFQKRKMKILVENETCFYITKNELIPKKPGVPSKDEIFRLNPYRGKIVEVFECVIYELKTRNILNRHLMRLKLCRR